MANEALPRYAESAGGYVTQDYTVADGTGIEKGTFLQLCDPRVASASVTYACPCAGILAREKVAGDGRTRISVYKKGYFDATASGAIGIGAALQLAGHNNKVMTASHALLSGTIMSMATAIIGYSEETADDGEVFLMRLNL